MKDVPHSQTEEFRYKTQEFIYRRRACCASFDFVDRFDDVGIYLGILADNSSRAIGRSVVMNDNVLGQ